MNIVIKGLHLEVTSAIDAYLEKKVLSLEKFLNEDARVEIAVGKTSNRHKSGIKYSAEIHVKSGREDARAKAEAEDVYAAIDMARDEMLEVLSSRKDKKKTLLKKGNQTIKKMTQGVRVKEAVALKKAPKKKLKLPVAKTKAVVKAGKAK